MPSLMKRPNSCSGPDCQGCSSANCMAEGGNVNSNKQRMHNEKGVHQADDETKGKSMAGIFTRHAKDPGVTGRASRDLAKTEHKNVLGELRSMPKPKLYAKGGEIKGVNKPSLSDPGTSEAGKKLKPAFSVGGSKWDTEAAKDVHRKTLGEMKDMKSQDRTNLAEGGEVSDHDEMHEALGHELMEAFDKKYKKGVMSAIEACVMRCMNKE